MTEFIEAHIYFEEAAGDFPCVFPIEDLINNTGITLSSGEQFLINSTVEEKIHIENLYFDGSTNSYGSILGACLVYNDGRKRWVNKVNSFSGDSQNLDVAIGNWVDGLSYNRAISSTNYKKSMIGKDGAVVELEFEPLPLRVCQLSLSPLTTNLVIGGDSKTITATHGSDVVSSHSWLVDTSKLKIVSSNSTSIQLEGLVEGTYTIVLQSNYDNNHQCSSSVQVVVSAPPPPPTCVVNILPEVMYLTKGETVKFTSTQNNSSGIKSFKWIVDEARFDAINASLNSVEIVSFFTGTYSIRLRIENLDGSICTGTATLIVSDATPPPTYEDPEEPDAPDEPDGGPPTVIGQQPVYKLFPYDEKDLAIKLPNIMKRNARYRGHRESEKTLHDNQEQIYEIRQNWKHINEFSNVLKETINGWFQGEQAKPLKNLTINQSKTFQTSSNKTRYPLIKDGTVRSFSNVVVKLNGIVVDPLNYYFSLGDLVYTSPTSTPQTLTISYTAKIELPQDFNKGIYSVKKRLQVLDERIAEAERRYQDVENAYN